MKERPILFSGPMVRAILAGRKTQTRRYLTSDTNYSCAELADLPRLRSHFGVPSDRLWVRETWGLCAPLDQSYWHTASIRDHGESVLGSWQVEYRAEWGSNQEGCHWRPSIHMPRWASRITLEVTGVRVERLQEISTLDAMAEGVEPRSNAAGVSSYTTGFHRLWDEINGKRAPWESNPWVWVIAFRRLP